MQVEVFAQLKEYFDKTFAVPLSVGNVSELKAYLIGQQPEAASVLESCRFAVNDEFINNSYQLKENDRISIVPPSSGG